MERRNCTKCHAEIQAFPANELSYPQYPGDTKYFGEGKCQKCMKAVLEFDGRSGLTMLVNPSRERLVVSETWLTTYVFHFITSVPRIITKFLLIDTLTDICGRSLSVPSLAAPMCDTAHVVRDTDFTFVVSHA